MLKIINKKLIISNIKSSYLKFIIFLLLYKNILIRFLLKNLIFLLLYILILF